MHRHVTPHRLQSTALEPAAVTFMAVLSAALSVVVSGLNLFLGALLIFAFFLDLASGLLKSIVLVPPGTRWFDGHKFMVGFGKKGLVVIGVLCAGVIDMALLYLPAWGQVAAQVTPATKTAIAYALFGQIASALQNVGVVKEAQQLAAFMLRRTDALKLGHEPPVRRAYDRAAVKIEQQLETVKGVPFHDAARMRDENTLEGS